MNIYEIPILLEEIMGDVEISPRLKQYLADPIYGKRVKFLIDRKFDENSIIGAVNIDKKFQMKNKAVVWVATQLSKNKQSVNAFQEDDWRTVFDWVRATNPDFMKLDNEQALQKAIEWHETTPDVDADTKGQLKRKYETNNVIYSGPGYKIVQLETRRDFDVEGKILSLCTTEDKNCSYYFGNSQRGYKYFSLRDNSNEPHVLCEFSSEGLFEQMQGHGNTAPEEKYKAQLHHWLSNEAPANAKLNDVVIERAMPEKAKQAFMKEIEEELIKELESSANGE